MGDDMTPEEMKRRQVGGASSATPVPGGAAASAMPAAASAPRAQVGTGFVGFDRYFAANQGAAQQMAQQVAGNVRQQAQAAQQATKGAQDTFAAKAQAAALQHDPAKAKTAADARGMAAQGYAGPKNWSEAGVDTGALAGQVAKAQDQVTGLGSLGGRAALLRESYRNNAPTSMGGSLLDAVLLGQAGGADFAALQGQYGGLGQQLVSAQGGAEAVSKSAQEQHAEAQERYGEQARVLGNQETKDAWVAQRDREEQERRARNEEALRNTRRFRAPSNPINWLVNG